MQTPQAQPVPGSAHFYISQKSQLTLVDSVNKISKLQCMESVRRAIQSHSYSRKNSMSYKDIKSTPENEIGYGIQSARSGITTAKLQSSNRSVKEIDNILLRPQSVVFSKNQIDEIQQSKIGSHAKFKSLNNILGNQISDSDRELKKVPYEIEGMLRQEWDNQSERFRKVGDYAEKVQKIADKQTVKFLDMKIMSKVLRRERIKSSRFQKKVLKQKDKIEQDFKDGICQEMDNAKIQEKETIKMLIKEQQNPKKDVEQLKRMMEETLRAKSVKNLIDKLKLEKAAIGIHKSAQKIKKLKEEGLYDCQYFSDQVKDPESLLQPLAVMFKLELSKDQKEKLAAKKAAEDLRNKINKPVSVYDDMKVDFFQEVKHLEKKKEDTLHDFKAKASSFFGNSEFEKLKLTKKVSQLTGGEEWNYVNKFGFKVRVQQPIILKQDEQVLNKTNTIGLLNHSRKQSDTILSKGTQSSRIKSCLSQHISSFSKLD